MKSRVLVVQHDDLSPLGAIGEHFTSDGITLEIMEPHRGDAFSSLVDFDILILLGGQMEVWQEQDHRWLVSEKAVIRHWVNDLDKPLLGICLGHQLLADALGGRVAKAKRGEAAVTNKQFTNAGVNHPLYAGFGKSKRAISWHGSEVTMAPPRAIVLGNTTDCAVSCFAVGSAAFGVQYHVEATDWQTETWAATPVGAKHLVQLHGAEGVPLVQQAIADAKPELWKNSKKFYDNFMQLARKTLDR